MTDQGLGRWLERRKLRAPHDIAIICDDERLTYARFADAADRVAGVLADQGVKRGDKVAFFGENSPDFLVTLFATVSLGAVFVPVNTRLAAQEIVYIINDSGAKILIHDDKLEDRLPVVMAECALEAVVRTGTAKGRLRALASQRPSDRPHVPSTFDDTAAILYTSGTTGRPKGAILSHGNLTWVAINTIVDYDVVSTDVALMISPLFHVASLGMGALPAILKGATLVVERGFEAGRALAQIERHGVTILSGVPTTFQMLSEHPNWDGADLSTLRSLTCGGSPTPTPVMAKFEARDLHFSQGYGMTEASPGVTSMSAHMTRSKQGSVGLPHFFSDLRVAGPDGEPLQTGHIGEIEIQGPNVTKGYLGLEEANAEAFTSDGWFRTGDLGYRDEDGYLFISGREKDMIISGGENIYPAEVEALIMGMDEVTGVAIVGAPDERWGEVPWAIITVTPDAVVTKTEVREFLEGKLARYKLPKKVVTVEELPRTASGKVRKHQLREQLRQAEN